MRGVRLLSILYNFYRNFSSIFEKSGKLCATMSRGFWSLWLTVSGSVQIDKLICLLCGKSIIWAKCAQQCRDDLCNGSDNLSGGNSVRLTSKLRMFQEMTELPRTILQISDGCVTQCWELKLVTLDCLTVSSLTLWPGEKLKYTWLLRGITGNDRIVSNNSSVLCRTLHTVLRA
jgi:hypothetical protein